MFSRRRRDLFGGLALHTDSLRYAELEREVGGLREIRREAVSLPPGCIIRGSVSQFDLLERAFRVLRKKLGRFRCPVALGVPTGDAVLKLLDHPLMPTEEVCDYFPWPRDAAVLDTAMIDAPVMASGIPSLAAAASLEYVNRLLLTARRAGIPIAALEPVDTAFFRAVTHGCPSEEDGLLLALEPEVHSLILSCHGHGVLFRSIPNNLKAGVSPNSEEGLQALAEDIRATLAFAANRFREIEVRHLVLGGSLGSGEPLRRALEERTALKVSLSNLYAPRFTPGFEAAVGLVLREPFAKTSTACFDLRPAEFIERERRRHVFSFVRLASALLALAFVLSCGGYIALALRELHSLSSKIMQQREEVAELEARQTALTSDISRLKEREERLARVLKGMERELPVLEVMDALERLSGPEIRLAAVRFVHSGSEDEGGGCVVTAEGGSSAPIHDLAERLGSEPIFNGVELLDTAQEDGTTTFKLQLTTGPWEAPLNKERDGEGK